MEHLASDFLRVVQQRTLDELLNGINITHLSNEDVNHFMYYCIGYVICLVLGVIIAIFLLILSCCVCCYRSDNIQHKASRKQENIFIGFVLVFGILGLVLCSSVFKQNYDLEQKTDADHGIMQKMHRGLMASDHFKNQLMNQIGQKLKNGKKESTQEISLILNQLQPSIDDLMIKENYLINESLRQACKTLDDINDDISLLSQNFDKQISIITKNIEDIETQMTNDTRNEADLLALLLEVKTNLSKSPYKGIQGLLNRYNSCSNTSYSGQYGKNESDRIGNTFLQQIKSLTQVSYKMVEEAITTKKEYLDIIEGFPTYRFKGAVLSFIPRFEFYGRIRFWVVLTLSSITCIVLSISLIIVLYLITKRQSNRTYEFGRILKYNFTCVLPVALLWLLMTMSMFLLGGLLRNEVCRYLFCEPEVKNAIGKVDRAVGIQIQEYAHTSFPVSLMNITGACMKNRTLFGALGFDTKRVDFLPSSRAHGLTQMLDQFEEHINLAEKRGNPFPRVNVSVLVWANILLVTKLVDYQSKLDEDNLLLSLQGLCSEIQKTDQCGCITPSNVTKQLKDLRGQMTQAVDMKNKLYGAIGNLTIKIQGFYNTSNHTEIGYARLAHNTSTKILAAYDHFAQNFDDDIKNKIGRCRPLFDASRTIVIPTCVGFLTPFSANWFTFGGCHFVLVLLAIFGLNLAKAYQSGCVNQMLMRLRPRRLSTNPLTGRSDRVAPDLLDIDEETDRIVNRRRSLAWGDVQEDNTKTANRRASSVWEGTNEVNFQPANRRGSIIYDGDQVATVHGGRRRSSIVWEGEQGDNVQATNRRGSSLWDGTQERTVNVPQRRHSTAFGGLDEVTLQGFSRRGSTSWDNSLAEAVQVCSRRGGSLWSGVQDGKASNALFGVPEESSSRRSSYALDGVPGQTVQAAQRRVSNIWDGMPGEAVQNQTRKGSRGWEGEELVLPSQTVHRKSSTGTSCLQEEPAQTAQRRGSSVWDGVLRETVPPRARRASVTYGDTGRGKLFSF